MGHWGIEMNQWLLGGCWGKSYSLTTRDVLQCIKDRIKMTVIYILRMIKKKKLLVDKLQHSGWTYLLTTSSTVTVEKAKAILSASLNIMLCCFLHLWLPVQHILYKKKAYDSYIWKYVTIEEQLLAEESLVLNQKSPMFKFRNTAFTTLLENY